VSKKQIKHAHQPKTNERQNSPRKQEKVQMSTHAQEFAKKKRKKKMVHSHKAAQETRLFICREVRMPMAEPESE